MSKESGKKEELILAGLQELRENGFNNFSIRRVASKCDVSCAAPYRHFKSKDDFVIEIFKYINRKWYMTQNMILSEYHDQRERLIEMSVAYVRFLVDNPDFLTILMTLNDPMNEEFQRKKSGVSTFVKDLIQQYCNDVGMSDSDRKRKTAIVRALIFGTAYIIHNGELENSELNFDLLRATVRREFEIG